MVLSPLLVSHVKSKVFSMKIAILSDIHGNSIAFDAVISDIESLNISEIVFLGDLVVKGPSPLEVFTKLKDLKPLCWIKGNTDTWFAEINDNWIPTTNQEREIYQDYGLLRRRYDGPRYIHK